MTDPILLTFVIIALVWSLVWKGLALWRAARRTDKWWFIVLLVVNTVGILEILYLFVFSKKEGETATATQESYQPTNQ